MKKNTLVTVLCGSMLLNAFMLGLAVPHLLMPHPFGPRSGGPNPILRMRDALEVLDQPYRDKVATILDAHGSTIQHDMDALHQSFEHMPDLLVSPEMNIEQFRAADKAMAARDAELHAEISSMIADIATSLPPEQRAKFFRETIPSKHRDFGPPP